MTKSISTPFTWFARALGLSTFQQNKQTAHQLSRLEQSQLEDIGINPNAIKSGELRLL